MVYFNGNDIKYAEFVEKQIDENTKKFYLPQKLKSILGSEEFIKEIVDKFFKKNPSKDISNKSK